MTINGSAQYVTVNSFRGAVEDRLKTEAKSRGRSLEELRREFLFQRFLAMVFAAPEGPWVLKGGAGLLMRMAHARFSKDLEFSLRSRANSARSVWPTGPSTSTSGRPTGTARPRRR